MEKELAVIKLPDVTEEEWLKVNEFNREVTEEFLLQGHLSPKTLNQYRSSLRIFFRFVMDKCRNLPIYELKPKHALLYQNMLISRNLSSSAVKFKRSTVSSLCGYMELYYNDEYPLFRNIYSKKIPNPPKQAVHQKVPLSPVELEFLATTLEEREEWQMLAYLRFSYVAGCRRAETSQLLKEVVNYNKVKDPKTGKEKNYYLTHIIRTKGAGIAGKTRKLQFDQKALDAIGKWLEVRGEDDCPYVFVNKNKNGVTRRLSLEAFNHWCSDSFSDIVGRRVHPHLLRSSRATNLSLYEDKNIDGIQALLGHQSSETTSIYIVKESDDDLDSLFD